ncbi:transmembrane and ubiquitin-like domain-containing protein 1 isoform X4 [Ostrinia furnacalis]|nr:transmembrane and ubiquitin-like domain-containing protein 1 isoform X4 [Ostrinia furnacalis]
MIANTPVSISQQASTAETIVTPGAIEDSRDASRVIPLQEMDSIIDADMAMMNNNRLHFYRRLDAALVNPGNVPAISDSASEDSETQEESEPASNDQIREMDSIVNAMEADVTARCDFFTRPNETNPAVTAGAKSGKDENASSTASNGNPGEACNNGSESQNAGADALKKMELEKNMIIIKLKYLNDTIKEVKGSLDELLKDFKLRHFSTELRAESRVRLIFNGRVLTDDAATLRACGLQDRAVVHCLVHPKRAAAPRVDDDNATPGTEATTGGGVEGAAPERSWDLENILMTLVSIALTVVWFFRCEYSNMFTASASVALFGLTVFYSVAIFGLYLSDTFHFDRRPAPAQPIPTN